MDEGKIYCTRCGKENSASSKFCRFCGAPIRVMPVPPRDQTETGSYTHTRMPVTEGFPPSGYGNGTTGKQPDFKITERKTDRVLCILTVILAIAAIFIPFDFMSKGASTLNDLGDSFYSYATGGHIGLPKALNLIGMISIYQRDESAGGIAMIVVISLLLALFAFLIIRGNMKQNTTLWIFGLLFLILMNIAAALQLAGFEAYSQNDLSDAVVYPLIFMISEIVMAIVIFIRTIVDSHKASVRKGRMEMYQYMQNYRRQDPHMRGYDDSDHRSPHNGDSNEHRKLY